LIYIDNNNNMPSPTTHYDVLGVGNNASDSEIKKAYRSLSLKHHPDRNPGGETKMHEINNAYEILSDSSKKEEYDQRIKMGHGDINEPAGRNNGSRGFPFPFGFPGGNVHMQGGHPDINHVFEAMFHGHNGVGGQPNIRVFRNGQPVFMKQKPNAVENLIHISLECAYNGMHISLDFERNIVTNGVQIKEQDKIPMHIPKGVKNGEVYVLSERGNINEGLKGDIKIKIKITEHEQFVRQQNDLVYKTKISLKDALCGFTVEIPHLNKKMLRISNQTNVETVYPGYQRILEDLGMITETEKGKLIVEFDVEFPKDITKEQREQLTNVL
jgi:DnaJ homolog subfamily B member 4